ncbi:MAG: phosphatidylglycerophosphatase A [Pyrinomonadaceae bacterium]|nr:phosphatidylglycerophosphatase A [Pyrinomonadaceae bacterium]
MPSYDEIIHVSATAEAQKLAEEKLKPKTALDCFALAVTTFGVGYLPLMPGTYGSVVGVVVYLLFGWLENNLSANFGANGWTASQIAAWVHVFNLVLFLLFCLLGIWAANRATVLFKNKDPQQAVVDEVIGQLIVFLFIPFNTHWYFVLSGFLLFRLFDIWKPYPIDSLQNLPAGIGVCADDILAGVYGGTCLALIYAVSLII